MKEVFTKIFLKYKLSSCRVTLLPNPKTKKYGTDTVAYISVRSGATSEV